MGQAVHGAFLPRLAVASVMLILTAYLDIRTREVSDRFWVAFSIAGAGLTLYEQVGAFDLEELLALSAITAGTAGLAYGGYRGGLFGGADAKALIALAVLLPTYDSPVAIHPLAPVITLSNGVLLTLVIPAYFGSSNLVRILRGEQIFAGFERERKLQKLFASLLGTRLARPRGFVFPIEKVELGQRRFVFNLLRDDSDFGAPPGSWVTPGLPLLVFFAAGFFVMLAIGDLLAIAIFSLAQL